MTSSLPELLAPIVGENLSAVTFVQDYIQLHFNPPPIMNIYSKVWVSSEGQKVSIGEPPFANLIVGQINKVLSSISHFEGQSLCLHFTDGSCIEISLKPEDRGKPEWESGEFLGRGENWVVF
jgi:hypothetical protein